MASLNPFYNWTKSLNEEDSKHPVLFIGHGSPMNGIEDNEFSRTWSKFGKEIPKPKAVLVISAHWLKLDRQELDIAHQKVVEENLQNHELFLDWALQLCVFRALTNVPK